MKSKIFIGVGLIIILGLGVIAICLKTRGHFNPVIEAIGRVEMVITKADYFYDDSAYDLVKEDFSLSQEMRNTEVCHSLAPEWERYKGYTKLRPYWLEKIEPYKDLEGMKEMLVKIKYGEFAEIYKQFKSLSPEVRQAIIMDNPSVTDREKEWLFKTWGIDN